MKFLKRRLKKKKTKGVALDFAIRIPSSLPSFSSVNRCDPQQADHMLQAEFPLPCGYLVEGEGHLGALQIPGHSLGLARGVGPS